MGYDISLVDDNGDSVQVERFSEGGTQPVGGSETADINITYNYSRYFSDTIDEEEGIRWIYGRKLSEIEDVLEHSVKVLGTYRDEDYWLPTPGNAGAIIEILLRWAKDNPEATFVGD